MPVKTLGTGRWMRKNKLTFDELVNEVKYHKRVFVQGGFIGAARGPIQRVRKQDLMVALEESDRALFDCTIFSRGIMVRGVQV